MRKVQRSQREPSGMQGGNTLHTCCVSKSMRLPGEVKAATANYGGSAMAT